MDLTPEIKAQFRVLCKAYPYTPLAFGVIAHPLISHQIELDKDGKFLLISADNFDDAVERRLEIVERLHTVEQLFVFLNKPFLLDMLNFMAPLLDNKTYSMLLGETWVQVEFPHQMPIPLLVKMFKRADRDVLMDEEERAVFCKAAMDPQMVFYRGIAGRRQKHRGLSWTMDKEKAEWFSRRLNGLGLVLEARCAPKHRLAYFAGREESEMVCNPYGLEIIGEYHITKGEE